MPESDETNFGCKAEKWELIRRAMKARTAERHERVTRADLDIAYTLLLAGLRQLLVEGYTVNLPNIGTLIPKKGRVRFRLDFDPQASLLMDMASFDAEGEEGLEMRKHVYAFVGIDAAGNVLFERAEARRQPPFGGGGALLSARAILRRHSEAETIIVYFDTEKDYELTRVNRKQLASGEIAQGADDAAQEDSDEE